MDVLFHPLIQYLCCHLDLEHQETSTEFSYRVIAQKVTFLSFERQHGGGYILVLLGLTSQYLSTLNLSGFNHFYLS